VQHLLIIQHIYQPYFPRVSDFVFRELADLSCSSTCFCCASYLLLVNCFCGALATVVSHSTRRDPNRVVSPRGIIRRGNVRESWDSCTSFFHFDCTYEKFRKTLSLVDKPSEAKRGGHYAIRVRCCVVRIQKYGIPKTRCAKSMRAPCEDRYTAM
jgi:hypothetical protein